MSGNIKYDKWVNDDNSENYKCRAWVNFNGNGTVAIREGGGVSSITDGGTGIFTVNFTTAMVDANYSIAGCAQSTGGGFTVHIYAASNSLSPLTSSGFPIGVTTNSGSSVDSETISVSVFR